MWVNIKKKVTICQLHLNFLKKEPGKVNELTWSEEPYILREVIQYIKHK